MTPDQAKKFAQDIATHSAPGPNGEPPHLSKPEAVAMAAALGAWLAASDPDTGALDKQTEARLQAGLDAANRSRDPDAVAFRDTILAIDVDTTDFATALQAGAQHVADGKGVPLDAQLQKDLADLALVVESSADVATIATAQIKG